MPPDAVHGYEPFETAEGQDGAIPPATKSDMVEIDVEDTHTAGGCDAHASAHVGFVHVNKAGGTEMLSILHDHARHQLLENALPHAKQALHTVGSRFFHASASLQQKAVGLAAWDAAYTFALVRNPFARQLSMFVFLLQTNSCQKAIGHRASHCEERRLPEAGAWLGDPAQVALKFRKWVQDMAAAFPVGTAKQHLFGARSHGNEYDPWYNASQISWLIDVNGRRLVDDVIRLEEFEARWPLLQSRICSLAPISYGQATALARRNPSKHEHYSYYYDEPTRAIVTSYMAADLAAFNYTFEHISLSPSPR